MDKELLDDDGYPTEETLTKIEEWDFKDWLGLIEFIESIWMHKDWGFVKKGKKVVRLELHTAGWSGNESIIHSLQKNFGFWCVCWQKSITGGHYYFKIKPIKPMKT